jgi:hypothetical protein
MRQTGGKADCANFPCGKAVTAVWPRAVPRKTQLPSIGKKFSADLPHGGKVGSRMMRRFGGGETTF